jgi:hypothetical protein
MSSSPCPCAAPSDRRPRSSDYQSKGR